VQASYGEGFRSLPAVNLVAGAAPYSKVRSAEVGVRASDSRRRYTTTLALFNTWVANELVFAAEEGGFETEGSNQRRGVVGSLVARPWPWLLSSTALSVTDATFDTKAPGTLHHVPGVPPILLRADVTVRGKIARFGERAVVGRVGAGYTFLAGRHLTDSIVGPASHVLNAVVGARYSAVELEIDAYNVLGLRYPDDAQAYVSNWNPGPGARLPSMATHVTAAPPRTALCTLTVHF
jgi:hypothetical protein